MPFQPGDRVHVVSFGKGVVLEARNAGRYLVDVKGRAMVVDERQLTAVERSRPGLPHDTQPAPSGAVESLARTQARASLDLHGLYVNQAVAALDVFLNDAMLAGLPEVRVIHGVRGGRLRDAVHRRLKQLTTVRAFRIDPANRGVTVVVL